MHIIAINIQHEAMADQHATHTKTADLHGKNSHHHRDHCNNCMACLTMLPASFNYQGQVAAPAVMLSQYFAEYVSPDTPQLDRPPIATPYLL